MATDSKFYMAGMRGEPLNSHGDLSGGVLKYPFQFISRAGSFECKVACYDDLVAALRRHSKAPGVFLLEADIDATAEWAVTSHEYNSKSAGLHVPVDPNWYIY